jgi:indolepyruvate ferredoxin oxidoreductase
LGDSVYANILLLGYAWQQGLVPLELGALMRAIELNGVAVDANKDAFNWGRVLFAHPEILTEPAVAAAAQAPTAAALRARHVKFLTGYQDVKWAAKYTAFIEGLEGQGLPAAFVEAVAKSLFKLMSYKDEYEVARLQSDPAFLADITAEFEGDFKIIHHLAPPLLPTGLDDRGRPNKRSFGPWMRKLFPLLAKLKTLRGTPFDPFGYHSERKMERELISWYKDVITEITANPAQLDWEAATKIAAAPLQMKGYGPVKLANVAKARAEVAELMGGIFS